MDVQKAQGTVEFWRGQIAEAEASRAVKVEQARVAAEQAEAKITETDRILDEMRAGLAAAEAELSTAIAEAEGAPPALHQAGGSGAAFDATIVTTES